MKWSGWPALAVAAYVLSFPPADLGPLAFVALWPWLRIVECHRGWRLAVVSYLTGAGILTLGCLWLAKSTPINLVLMVLSQAPFLVGFAFLLRRLRVHARWPAALCLPAAWVAVEFLRSRYPLDGFPWLVLGYTQHRWLALLQCSDLVGVFAFSLLCALGAGCLEDVGRGRGRRRAVPAVGFAVVLAAAVTYGSRRLDDALPQEAGPRVLVVQASIPQEVKSAVTRRQEETSQEHMLEQHLDLTRQGLAGARDVDLVVWPETMFPYALDREARVGMEGPVQERILEPLSRMLLAPHRASLLFGVVTFREGEEPDTYREWNSAVLLTPDGRRAATYDKEILVPGGEYLPFLGILPRAFGHWLADLVTSLGGPGVGLERGDGPCCLDVPFRGGSFRAGLSICYEIAYPHYFRRIVQEGAEILFNLSNEAWYPDSAEFAQYTAMAAFRAAETRRWMIRAANSGTSAWIDPWGRVTALEEDGRLHGFAGTLLASPSRCHATTVYLRVGDVAGWGAVIVSFLLLVVPGRRRKARAATVTGAPKSF